MVKPSLARRVLRIAKSVAKSVATLPSLGGRRLISPPPAQYVCSFDQSHVRFRLTVVIAIISGRDRLRVIYRNLRH